jgi:hypothetical protein
MFKVVTTSGVLVNGGMSGHGLGEEAAKADAAARNRRAEQLRLETRYEVRPLTS